MEQSKSCGYKIKLTQCPRRFHLVTGELLRELPELRNFKVGMANICIMHTSASLTISENADPTVIYRMMRRLFSKKD